MNAELGFDHSKSVQYTFTMAANKGSHQQGSTTMQDTKQMRAATKRERQLAITQARRNKNTRQAYEASGFADFSAAYTVKGR